VKDTVEWCFYYACSSANWNLSFVWFVLLKTGYEFCLVNHLLRFCVSSLEQVSQSINISEWHYRRWKRCCNKDFQSEIDFLCLFQSTPLKYNPPLTIPHYDPPFKNSQLLPRKYNPPFNYSHCLPPNYISPLNNSHFLPLN
jgi:hypothetical protein